MGVMSEKDLHSDLDATTRRMALEARELYLVQIERNLAALAEQIVLLQTTLDERKSCWAGSPHALRGERS
jgi:hypothetical protein